MGKAIMPVLGNRHTWVSLSNVCMPAHHCMLHREQTGGIVHLSAVTGYDITVITEIVG